MKTLVVSLAALVAVSGAALADGDDLRSSDTYFGKYSTRHKMESSATDRNAFAVVKASKNKKKLTAFERMNMREAEGRGGEARQSRGPAESMM
jgi:hypothetical protein